MKKRYITPETEAIEVNEADIITTSGMLTLGDDDWDINKEAFNGTGIYDLF